MATLPLAIRQRGPYLEIEPRRNRAGKTEKKNRRLSMQKLMEAKAPVSDNKELLREAAAAFNNVADRSGWYDFHAASVQAYGLAPAALELAGLRDFYNTIWTAFPDLT